MTPETNTPTAPHREVTGWFTSSYTAGDGNCVEVARLTSGGGLLIRDSKARRAKPAHASKAAWAAFLTAVTLSGFEGSP
ncbi:hypothetical protein GCM10027160_00620 [Streptomyces calidiresistens]|uniref:DUF397 domain-containing protein n=1 Tax=Streptomyces calidiresistens TaxID=1485586 RepID=A0A7W3SZU3_9ACTN|nr:DUF397 domain-containing protein [Streptomyces calidiresistens]MBB0228330.1 DUF397 domain-containing protein [Streptomyces calidiresistens]